MNGEIERMGILKIIKNKKPSSDYSKELKFELSNLLINLPKERLTLGRN